jgi:hypothetical protein
MSWQPISHLADINALLCAIRAASKSARGSIDVIVEASPDNDNHINVSSQRLHENENLLIGQECFTWPEKQDLSGQAQISKQSLYVHITDSTMLCLASPMFRPLAH